MRALLNAAFRALRALFRRDILWHVLWPGLAASLIWLLIAVLGWSYAVEAVLGWLSGWGWLRDTILAGGAGSAVLSVLVNIALLLALVPLVYLTAAVLVATIALPIMLERVGRTDFAALERRNGGSNTGSALNALFAAAGFVAIMLVSLPLWLIPGAGVVISVLATGWLNQRSFRYDALMLHADRDEMQQLWRERRGDLMLIGVGCALLAYIPLFNLLVPALCGLTYVFYLLDALNRQRGEIELLPAQAQPPMRRD